MAFNGKNLKRKKTTSFQPHLTVLELIVLLKECPWSIKYVNKCSMCHLMFPRRKNELGNLKNLFVWPLQTHKKNSLMLWALFSNFYFFKLCLLIFSMILKILSIWIFCAFSCKINQISLLTNMKIKRQVQSGLTKDILT